MRGKYPKLLSGRVTEYEWTEKYHWHPRTVSVTRSVSNLKKTAWFFYYAIIYFELRKTSKSTKMQKRCIPWRHITKYYTISIILFSERARKFNYFRFDRHPYITFEFRIIDKFYTCQLYSTIYYPLYGRVKRIFLPNRHITRNSIFQTGQQSWFQRILK